MAVLTSTELARARQDVVSGFGVEKAVTWNETQINAASQAIVDRLVGSIGFLNSDIEAAAPGVFTANQKIRIFSHAAERFVAQELGAL